MPAKMRKQLLLLALVAPLSARHHASRRTARLSECPECCVPDSPIEGVSCDGCSLAAMQAGALLDKAASTCDSLAALEACLAKGKARGGDGLACVTDDDLGFGVHDMTQDVHKCCCPFTDGGCLEPGVPPPTDDDYSDDGPVVNTSAHLVANATCLAALQPAYSPIGATWRAYQACVGYNTSTHGKNSSHWRDPDCGDGLAAGLRATLGALLAAHDEVLGGCAAALPPVAPMLHAAGRNSSFATCRFQQPRYRDAYTDGWLDWQSMVFARKDEAVNATKACVKAAFKPGCSPFHDFDDDDDAPPAAARSGTPHQKDAASTGSHVSTV